ncbi:MAG: DUF72 domain-containing protein [Deltaproteobacteria bacterium]|nr:DUF72 domain-containing protein [Deltaproteobacteria bacterium]
MTKENVRCLIGTSGWTYPHWKGVFYPEDVAQSRWFDYYTRQFLTVEINATFYRSFGESTYRKWRDRAPPGFKFVLKVPRFITHRKYLKDLEESINRFWESAVILEDSLGLVLLQLAPHTPYDPERLRKALVAFGDPGNVAVEFRHKKWFTEEIKEMLKETRSVFCISDSPDTPLLAWATSETAYIRLHGRARWYDYDYSEQDFNEIAVFAGKVSRIGARTVYIFFNNDSCGYAPHNALSLMKILGTKAWPISGSQGLRMG